MCLGLQDAALPSKACLLPVESSRDEHVPYDTEPRGRPHCEAALRPGRPSTSLLVISDTESTISKCVDESNQQAIPEKLPESGMKNQNSSNSIWTQNNWVGAER